MQAYKLFFNIFKRKTMLISIAYILGFASLAFVFSTMATKQIEGFSLSKCSVAVIDNDNSELSKQLTQHLSKNATLVEIKSDEQSQKDALFFRKADYIAIIPTGFEKSFLDNSPLEIQSMQIPESVEATFVSRFIDSFLNTAKVYHNATGKMNLDLVAKDLSTSADATVLQSTNTNLQSNFAMFANFSPYPIILVMIFAVGMVVLSVNKTDVRLRYIASPQKPVSFTTKMLVSNIAIMFMVYLPFVLISIFAYGKDIPLEKGIWFFLNGLALCIFALSLSFLIANIANKNAIITLSNGISLAFAFLSGCFVPQFLLGEGLRKIGIMNPVFWYVKSVDTLDTLSIINSKTLTPIIQGIGIQLAFACALVAITMVVIKQKQTTN